MNKDILYPAGTFLFGVLLTAALFTIANFGDDAGGKGPRMKMEKHEKHEMHEMEGMQGMKHDMGAMMMDMAGNMKGLTGEELEKVFLQDMIPHHEGAVEMAELLKAGTTRPELLEMADAIIEAQTKEIEQMKTWQKEWFQN